MRIRKKYETKIKGINMHACVFAKFIYRSIYKTYWIVANVIDV